MKVRVLLGLLLIVMAVANVAFGQALDNFNFIGDGARARGMGGAFISIADDASAITWNPAGLIQIIDPQLTFALDYFHPKTNFKLTYSEHAAQNIAHKFQDNKYPFSFASFTAPVRIMGHPIVAAASFSSVSTRHDYFEVNPDSGTVDTAFVNFVEKVDSRLNKLRLGFGTNVYKNLDFGAGIDIYFGKGYVDTLFEYSTYYIHPEQQVRVDIISRGYVADTVTFSGFNFVGGLLWDAEKFAIGATIKTPFWLTQKHIKHTSDTLWENGLKRYNAGDIDELAKERIKLPWMIGLGASYNISEGFIVSSDFEWRRYGVADFRIHWDTTLSNGEIQQHFITNNLGMYNGYQARFGAEYKLKTGFAEIPLRAGFRYESFGFRDIKDYHINFVDWSRVYRDSLIQTQGLGDQITGYAITAGTGLHWQRIRLDFAVEYEARDKNIDGIDFFGPFEAVKENRGVTIHLNFTGLFK